MTIYLYLCISLGFFVKLSVKIPDSLSLYIYIFHWYDPDIDGLLQDCSKSIANALELLQFCT